MYDYLLITNVYNIKAIQQMIGKDYTTEGNLSRLSELVQCTCIY